MIFPQQKYPARIFPGVLCGLFFCSGHPPDEYTNTHFATDLSHWNGSLYSEWTGPLFYSLVLLFSILFKFSCRLCLSGVTSFRNVMTYSLGFLIQVPIAGYVINEQELDIA